MLLRVTVGRGRRVHLAVGPYPGWTLCGLGWTDEWPSHTAVDCKRCLRHQKGH